jgi:predicted ATPase
MELPEKESGLIEIKTTIAAWREKDWELLLPCFLSILAKAFKINKQHNEALKALDEAITLMNKNAELTLESELLRLKGEMILLNVHKVAGENEKEAEMFFQHSIEVARQQKVKTLELRSAITLSRLWLKQGNIIEGKKLLSQTVEWFTEGMQTSDLLEAQALLSELV